MGSKLPWYSGQTLQSSASWSLQSSPGRDSIGTKKWESDRCRSSGGGGGGVPDLKLNHNKMMMLMKLKKVWSILMPFCVPLKYPPGSQFEVKPFIYFSFSRQHWFHASLSWKKCYIIYPKKTPFWAFFDNGWITNTLCFPSLVDGSYETGSN